MDLPPPTPIQEEPPKNRTGLYIGIAVFVLLCCCCIAVLVVFFGYDNWGDPLGIYGLLPQPLHPMMM